MRFFSGFRKKIFLIQPKSKKKFRLTVVNFRSFQSSTGKRYNQDRLKYSTELKKHTKQSVS